MGTKAKKITSLFFLLIGLAPLLYVFVISIKKQEIRDRMEEQMELGDLQTLILPEQEVVWMDKNEIWANNSMFDIHTKQLENGIYTFTGLYDAEETMLVEEEKEAEEKNNEQSKLLTELLDCLPIFCIQHKEINNPTLQDYKYYPFVTRNPINQFREILTPPPQV